ncbi:hypothetical protein BKA60DRAFT_556946 [Fusarium oxysporum]|nr:hypothetical protein BKA60DRAFT_556946 [Fusarium oxysporum]
MPTTPTAWTASSRWLTSIAKCYPGTLTKKSIQAPRRTTLRLPLSSRTLISMPKMSGNNGMSRQASQMAPEPRRSGSDSPILQVDLAGSEDVIVNILNSCVQFLDAILSVVISFSMRSWLYTLAEVWSYHPRCELLSSESKADKLTVVNGKKAPRGSFKQHMKFTFDRSQPTIRQSKACTQSLYHPCPLEDKQELGALPIHNFQKHVHRHRQKQYLRAYPE